MHGFLTLAWLAVQTINKVFHLPMVYHTMGRFGETEPRTCTRSTWNATVEHNLRGRSHPPLTEAELEELCTEGRYEGPYWEE